MWYDLPSTFANVAHFLSRFGIASAAIFDVNNAPKLDNRSIELPGIQVTLDRLVYFHESDPSVSEAPHAFIYFLSVHNLSDRKIRLCGRRWVIRNRTGAIDVIEGDGIVGKQPTLAPGETFSYNSHHAVVTDSVASGSFHGVDSEGAAIHVRIPSIEMKLPSDTPDSASHEVD